MTAQVRPPLHVDLIGQGRSVVMLHGWGMHSGLFRPLALQLAGSQRVALVDLPGHGKSDDFEHFANLFLHADYLVSQLKHLFAQGVTLIGWSLGGLLAQAIAIKYPQHVSQLVLICSTPRFVQAPDWFCAVDENVLQRFTDELRHDVQATLMRFLALQFMSAQHPKQNLRHARELLMASPQPRVDMLQQGLHLLVHGDLRAKVNAIRCPSLIIGAEHDTLVPPAAVTFLAQRIPAGRCVIIKGAGHAPFLSHPDTVIYFLEKFLHEH